MKFQTAEVIQKDGNKVKLSCELMVTFSEGNGLVEVEEGDSKDTLACDDDAHKGDLCT